MFRVASPTLASVCLLATGPSACEAPEDEDAAGEIEAREGEGGEGASDENGALIVYEIRTSRADDGAQTVLLEYGALDEAVAERAARPWTFVNEPYVYQEEAWELPLADGAVEQGYRIIRTPSDSISMPESELGTIIAPTLAQVIESGLAPADSVIDVHIRIRDFPGWDIPARPTSMLLAASDLEAAVLRRTEAIAARQQLAEGMASGIAAEIEDSGGEVRAVRGSSGWIWASVPLGAIEGLALRSDIESIRQPNEQAVGQAWRQGDGRWATRMNADTFHTVGWDGGIANASRHSFGRLAAAVIEAPPAGVLVSGLEDEACAFYDCQGPADVIACSSADVIAGLRPAGDRDRGRPAIGVPVRQM